MSYRNGVGGCGLDSTGSGFEILAGSSGHSNKYYCSIEGVIFIDYVSNYFLVKKNCEATWGH